MKEINCRLADTDSTIEDLEQRVLKRDRGYLVYFTDPISNERQVAVIADYRSDDRTFVLITGITCKYTDNYTKKTADYIPSPARVPVRIHGKYTKVYELSPEEFENHVLMESI